MCNDMNMVVLLGSVTSVPERRKSENGLDMVSFSLKTSNQILAMNPMVSPVEWHRIFAYSAMIKTVKQQDLHKGDQIYLEGHLQTRKWTDSAGLLRHDTDIVLDKLARLEEQMVETRDRSDLPNDVIHLYQLSCDKDY